MTIEDKKKYYDEGRRDRKDGATEWDCPYEMVPDKALYWFMGFNRKGFRP